MGFSYSIGWIRAVKERGGCTHCMEDGDDPILASQPCTACGGTGLNPERKGTYYADGTLDKETRCDEQRNAAWKCSK